MDKKLVIILPLLMLAFMLGSAQISKAAESQSYKSNAVTGFYGEYVVEDETSNNGTNNGNNNGTNISNNNGSSGSNGSGLGATPSGELPVTGDSNNMLPTIGSLVILGVAVLYLRRRMLVLN